MSKGKEAVVTPWEVKGNIDYGKLIEKFGVSIDLDRDSGGVKITGDNKENILNAAEHIKNISSNAKSFQKKVDQISNKYAFSLRHR